MSDCYNVLGLRSERNSWFRCEVVVFMGGTIKLSDRKGNRLTDELETVEETEFLVKRYRSITSKLRSLDSSEVTKTSICNKKTESLLSETSTRD